MVKFYIVATLLGVTKFCEKGIGKFIVSKLSNNLAINIFSSGMKVALKHQKFKKKSILFFFFVFGNGNSFSFYSDITKERLFLNIYTMPCVNKQ
jgi:hypothetical protein